MGVDEMGINCLELDVHNSFCSVLENKTLSLFQKLTACNKIRIHI